MRQGIKKKITALTITSAMVAATLGGGNFAFAAKNQPQNEGQRPTVATGSSIGVIGEKPNKKPVTPGAIDAKPDKKNDENKPSEGNNDIKEPVTPGAVTAKPEPANTAKRKVPKKVKVKKARKTVKNKIQITLDGTNVWSKLSVTVKTATGKSVKTSIVKKGKNSCVLKTKKQLSKGTYTIKIKGVKVKGETKYETITTKVKVK